MPSGTEFQRAYERGAFPLTKKIDGETWTVYAGTDFDTKESAEQSATWLRADGYKVRVFKTAGKYYLAWRK